MCTQMATPLHTMLTTGTILPIHPSSSLTAAMMEQDENLCPLKLTSKKQRQQRRVCFADNFTTDVFQVEDSTQEHPEMIWYSKKELREFRSSAKALADRIRIRQPSLVQEITDAYDVAKLKAQSRTSMQLSGVIETTKLYNKWSKLGSSRRGLERWVFPKAERAARIEEVRASRSIVLNVQCLLKRGGAVNQEEMLRQQYVELAKTAQIVAQQMAQADQAAAMKHYKAAAGHDDEEPDEEDEDSVCPLSSASSVCSKASSACSLSGQKLKPRRRERRESTTSKKSTSSSSSKTVVSSSSNSSGRSKSRRSSDKSASAPRRRTSKSPLRRLSFTSLTRVV